MNRNREYMRRQKGNRSYGTLEKDSLYWKKESVVEHLTQLDVD